MITFTRINYLKLYNKFYMAYKFYNINWVVHNSNNVTSIKLSKKNFTINSMWHIYTQVCICMYVRWFILQKKQNKQTCIQICLFISTCKFTLFKSVFAIL